MIAEIQKICPLSGILHDFLQDFAGQGSRKGARSRHMDFFETAVFQNLSQFVGQEQIGDGPGCAARLICIDFRLSTHQSFPPSLLHFRLVETEDAETFLPAGKQPLYPGIIRMILMCYELIQLIVEKNNLHDFDTWIFFKWIFKTFCAVLIVTNTWNIVMAVFDVAQNVVSQSAGVIISDAGIDISGVTADLETQLADWSIGALLGLWFQSIFVGLCTQILSICIFLVIYGRMIEVYLVTSIGPIPFATMVNREWGNTGQNYLRSLLALGFQAFLIMICVGIYAVLVEGISLSGDNISGAIWGCMGYTVLLCFTLFKTGSLAKSLFGAH